MNKLHVALKLLMLLNERKSIDSGLVAEVLNVSLRTAQRYLNELSGLPCVETSDENYRTYNLSPDYRLKNALANGCTPEPSPGQSGEEVNSSPSLGMMVCKICGSECEKSGIWSGENLHGIWSDG